MFSPDLVFSWLWVLVFSVSAYIQQWVIIIIMLGFTFSSNTRDVVWWAYEGCGYDEFVYDWSERCGF